MSSHARSSREGQRRLSIRTLIFASIGSAVAAILTSRFWGPGTPIAAALTPVIVALVSELLNRPTERIAQRFTTETRALPETDSLPEAAGAGPPPRDAEREPRPAREAPAARPPPGATGGPRPRRAPAGDPAFHVYRPAAGSNLPWKTIVVTGAIAFAIAAALLTVPELIAGQSLGSGDTKTTLFRGDRSEGDSQAPDEQQREGQQTQATQPESDQPGRTGTTPQPTPEKTTPTTPPSTTTQPAQPRTSPAPPAPQQP